MDPEVEMKYAPDILKAMIRAKQEKGIPDQLKDMAKKFKDKVRDGSAIAYESRGYKTKAVTKWFLSSVLKCKETITKTFEISNTSISMYGFEQ